MKALFRVRFFDPRNQNLNMESYTVIAANAADAIRRTDSMKLLKSYKAESVEFIDFVEKP